MTTNRYEKEKKTQKEYNKTPRGVIARKRATNNYLLKVRNMMKELKLNGCSICGYNSCNSALTFHHVDKEEKKYNLTMTVIAGQTNETIIRELNKCVLLCENCHRELHEKERKV
jgi:hypothetical protein